MQPIIIQIYEIQNPREAAAVAELGVDHIGTVLLSRQDWKNPVLRDTVRAVQHAGAKSGLIPLFGDPETIRLALDYYQPDFVHFCEILSPYPLDRDEAGRQCDALLLRQRSIRESFPEITIMRSLSVPQAGTNPGDAVTAQILSYIPIFTPVTDFFLIDTLRGDPLHETQPVDGFVGITGEVCDWDISVRIVDESPLPVILAGGIGAENVYEGILTVRPAGVDSCTRTNAEEPDGRPIRFKKTCRKWKEWLQRREKLPSPWLNTYDTRHASLRKQVPEPGLNRLVPLAQLVCILADFLHVIPVIFPQSPFNRFWACIVGGQDIIPENLVPVSLLLILIAQVP